MRHSLLTATVHSSRAGCAGQHSWPLTGLHWNSSVSHQLILKSYITTPQLLQVLSWDPRKEIIIDTSRATRINVNARKLWALYVYTSCCWLVQLNSWSILSLLPQMITFRFITWHFRRSKPSASSAIFLHIFSCLQAIRTEQFFLFAGGNMQNKNCGTTEWSEKWAHTGILAHHGESHRPLFVQCSSFCLLSKQDVQVSG